MLTAIDDTIMETNASWVTGAFAKPELSMVVGLGKISCCVAGLFDAVVMLALSRSYCAGFGNGLASSMAQTTSSPSRLFLTP
jgi:hypothetical protein